MLKKFALIGAAACLAVSGSAFAQGLYVGAEIGGTGLTSPITATDTDTTGTTSATADYAKNGFSGGIFGGYVFCLGNGFALAPELRGDWTNAKSTLGFTGNDANSATQKLAGTFNISVRPGYYVTDSTMIYGRVGYSWSKFTTTFSDTTGSNASLAKTLGGWAFGGGVEVNLTGQLGLRGDYVYTRYNSQNLVNSAQGFNLSTKPSTNTLHVGLVYTIGNPMQLGA